MSVKNIKEHRLIQGIKAKGQEIVKYIKKKKKHKKTSSLVANVGRFEFKWYVY